MLKIKKLPSGGFFLSNVERSGKSKVKSQKSKDERRKTEDGRAKNTLARTFSP